MKKIFFYILIISIPIILSILAYFLWLPDQIPVQFTSNGVRYANKAYIFIFAAIPSVVVLNFALKKKYRNKKIK